MTIVVYVGNGVAAGLIQPTTAMLATVLSADIKIVEASEICVISLFGGSRLQYRSKGEEASEAFLNSGDLIVVPGGNAFSLSTSLSKVIHFLKEYPGFGIKYFGICAGAILWQLCDLNIRFGFRLGNFEQTPLLIDVGEKESVTVFAKVSPGISLDKSSEAYNCVSKMPDSWVGEEGKPSYALLVSEGVLLSGPHFEMAFWNKEVASSEVINMLSKLDMEKVTSPENQERVSGLLAQRMAEAGFKVKTAPVAAEVDTLELQGGGAAVAAPTPVPAFSLRP